MNIKRMNKVIFIMFIFFCIFNFKILGDILEPCKNTDECGKVIGWIFDYDTKEIIKEKFRVLLIPHSEANESLKNYYLLDTKSGYFSIRVKPGKFYLVFTPLSSGSKYPYFFNPYLNIKKQQMITVEVGKITEIIKKVQEGGQLKVVLVNPQGKKINPFEYFSVFRVSFWLKSEEVGYYNSIAFDKSEIELSETIVPNLIPGIYIIRPYFSWSGYGNTKKDFINIVRKQTTEYKITINPDNITGIHGFIKDKNGNPLKFGQVWLKKDTSDDSYIDAADVFFREDGYYKIIGLEEGTYRMYLEIEEKEDYIWFYNIKILNNQLLLKNITIN